MNNRFYVYVHKIVGTDEIFYVGKGTQSRITSKHGRNSTWKNITEATDWYSEKYKENLTEDEAVTLEVELISKFQPRANVHTGDIRPRVFNWEDFTDRYYYDPSSPSGLRYTKWNGQHGKKRREAGDTSGIAGVSYTGRSKMAVIAQKTLRGKYHSKRFNIKELGLIPSLYAAQLWLKSLE